MRYLSNLVPDFNACTVVSEPEHRRLTQIVPGYAPITIIPNGVDAAHYDEIAAEIAAEPQPDTLIYSGSLTYHANFDAVEFFLCGVFPLIQAQRPNVKLFVTGKLDGVSIDSLPHDSGVTFTGYLDDVRPLVANSWISIVPLRVGGGTRLKILESLALGTPVVSTSKGAEGLDLASGRDILIADKPTDFAAAVLRLLQDASLRGALGKNGRLAVTRKYDWGTIGGQFCDLIENVSTRP
jgi:glycosyltransferase involved in cell wall biosynthesis